MRKYSFTKWKGVRSMNKAVFKENIKRFWPISFAAFIAYFMTGPFYLFQTSVEASYGSLANAVSTANIGYAFVTCAMTVAVGAAVYAYLFKVNSTVFMHAAPASRRDLFISSAASGLSLAFIPVILNALVLIAIKLSGKYDVYSPSGSEFRTAEMWNVKSILSWAIVVFVEIVFIFAICTLSAMISGNGVINVLTSIGLNLLTTLVYLSAIAYGSSFIFGFLESSMSEDAMCRLHPVLNYGVNNFLFGNEEVYISDFSLLVYLLVSAVIFAAAYWLYTKRSNEKTGDSYVFDIVSVVISVLMVYMGASCIGLIFGIEQGYKGFIIGGLFSFFIGQLIIQKSFRIFNRKLLVSLAASVAVMALVIGGFALDLFGVERKVPKAEDVTSIDFSDSGVYGVGYNLESPENIAVITEFHKGIIEHKSEIRELQSPDTPMDGIRWYWFEINYNLKDGRTLKRHYNVPANYSGGFECLDKVYESEDVIKILDSLKIAEPEDAQISLFMNRYDWDGDINPYSEQYGMPFDDKYNDYYGMTDLSSSEKTALMKALCSDIERIGLRNIDNLNNGPLFEVRIELVHPFDENVAVEPSVTVSGSNYHTYRYNYDENGVKNGVIEDFNFVVLEDFTDTLTVIESILESRFN